MKLLTVNLGNKAHNVTRTQQRLRLGQLTSAAAPDVIVTQEARYPFLPLPRGYRAIPQVGGVHQVRLIIKATLPVIGHGYMRIHPGLEHNWPARELPFLTLALGPDGTRRPTTVLGVHLNSAIEAGGKFAPLGLRRVYTLAHLDALVAQARAFDRLGHRVAVVGDTNFDAYADRKVRDRNGLTERFTGKAQGIGFHEALPLKPSGTHHSRRIDRLFHTTDLAVTVRDLPRRDPFDHQPVLFTTSPR